MNASVDHEDSGPIILPEVSSREIVPENHAAAENRPVPTILPRAVRALAKKYRTAEFPISGWIIRAQSRTYPLRTHIEALLGWLLRAQQQSADDGVAESFVYQTQQWRPSYPETTGYIICSILRAANAGYGDTEILRDAARRMGEWLVDVQYREGGFPGGHIGVKEQKPVVFNTGQILKGLTDLCSEGLDTSGRLRRSADLAANWLINSQDSDGAWRRGLSHLTKQAPHAYDVRTAWALARYGCRFGRDDAVQAGIRNAEWLMTIREPDMWFREMNMHPEKSVILHAVAYTINGLLELGVLADRSDFIEAAQVAAGLVAKSQNLETGAVPGQFELGYKHMVNWTSMTGNSQMAIIWYRLAEITGEAHWRNHARLANLFNRKLHEIEARNPGTRGAVRGSWPSHQGYGSYWYMNWTQKFFLDALLAETGVPIQ